MESTAYLFLVAGMCYNILIQKLFSITHTTTTTTKEKCLLI